MTPKTVLITGCSDGGIGSGLTRVFADRGLSVIATARIAAALKMVSAEAGGKLDYLVNNAGGAYRAAALEVDDRMARDLFDVNFWGVVDMCRAFGPLVIRAKGTIVNVASLNGHGVPMVWNSSKAAVGSYSDTLRLELSPFGVKVLTLVSGAVQTNMNNEHSLSPATLPAEGSVFKPAEEHIAKATIPERMTIETFAAKVVGDILSGASGWNYRGAFATRTWFLMTFLPSALWDKVVTLNTGLNLLGH